eukprot:9498045-Pyramimonas_sp.AAC.2
MMCKNIWHPPSKSHPVPRELLFDEIVKWQRISVRFAEPAHLRFVRPRRPQVRAKEFHVPWGDWSQR